MHLYQILRLYLYDWPLAAYGCVVDALCDPQRRNRAILILSVAYGVSWSVYAIVAKSSQGMNIDMAEMVIWGRNFAWGYPKHPPLLGWIIGAWFALFPNTDWPFYVLSGITLGAGLYLSFFLAGEWLDGVKRATVPFLLALIPFNNFLGLKFDQNSVLIPLWALTTWALIRSIKTRSPGWAALAGLAAAASALSKYWSVYLLLALAVAALYDPRRRRYFSSSAPWITILVGAIAISPHAVWLVQENFKPTVWVTTRRLSASLLDALRSLSEYSFGTLGYAAVALAMVAIFVRPSLAGWRDTLLPREPMRREAAITFWLPLLIPIPVSFVLGVNLLSLWNTMALTMLPVVLLSSPLIVVTRHAASMIVGAAVILTIAPLLASPLVAYQLRTSVENDAPYTYEAAAVLDRNWRRVTTAPLKIVAGPNVLASPVAFYAHDRPNNFADFSPYLSPWTSEQAIVRDGVAVICQADDASCIAQAERLAAQNPASRRSEETLTPRWFGYSGLPKRFTIVIVPPAKSP